MNLGLFADEKVDAVTLRQYQNESIKSVYKDWESVNSTLLVLPTGTGKTVCFSEIIKRKPGQKKVLVLAHREELIFQAVEKIRQMTGLETEVEMADQRAIDTNPTVIVSTIQTQNAGRINKRMTQWHPDEFEMLIIDEAHHATANSYKNVINYYSQNPHLKVLGVTATPDRADEEALGQVFESVAFDYEMIDAINDGWLVPVEQQFVQVDSLDFSEAKTTAGDINGADLNKIMEYEESLHGIVGPLVQIAGNRKTLLFAASLAQAERMCEIINRHKHDCAKFVSGKTDKIDRRDIVRSFAKNEFQFLCNVGCFTEGFDDPGVEVIGMARPTKSRSLYAQMAGRGTRPWPGTVDGHFEDCPDIRKNAIQDSKKPSCLIVDFVGNSGRHKLMSTADILGGNVSDEICERAEKMAKESDEPKRMDELFSEAAAELEKERLVAEARRARIRAKTTFNTVKINPFDAFGLTPVKERGWDKGKQISEKQANMLKKAGMNPDDFNYAQAKQVIKEMFRRWDSNLCTVKQVNVLKKYGYDGKDMTMKEAGKLIDAIAANGWKRPDD